MGTAITNDLARPSFIWVVTSLGSLEKNTKIKQVTITNKFKKNKECRERKLTLTLTIHASYVKNEQEF